MLKERERTIYGKRLKNIIGKKFDTTMIGSLSQFEMAFGSLWGHGKDENDLTKTELANLNIWRQCRDTILTLGNNQKRNAFAELDTHEIEKKKFHTIMYPSKSYNDQFNR